MFMRYLGGGLGHLSQVPLSTDPEAMDVDAPFADEGPDSALDDDCHQVNQLEQLVQLAAAGSSEGSEELDPGQDLSDQEDSEEDTASSYSDSSLGNPSDGDMDDLGPEDGEGIGDEDSDDGYGSG